MIILLLSAALAACPWGAHPSAVEARHGSITVDGYTLPVKGRSAEAAAAAVLRECGDGDAVPHLAEWRRQARISGWMGGLSLVFWPTLLALPVTLPRMGRARTAVEVAIAEG